MHLAPQIFDATTKAQALFKKSARAFFKAHEVVYCLLDDTCLGRQILGLIHNYAICIECAMDLGASGDASNVFEETFCDFTRAYFTEEPYGEPWDCSWDRMGWNLRDKAWFYGRQDEEPLSQDAESVHAEKSHAQPETSREIVQALSYFNSIEGRLTTQPLVTSRLQQMLTALLPHISFIHVAESSESKSCPMVRLKTSAIQENRMHEDGWILWRWICENPQEAALMAGLFFVPGGPLIKAGQLALRGAQAARLVTAITDIALAATTTTEGALVATAAATGTAVLLQESVKKQHKSSSEKKAHHKTPRSKKGGDILPFVKKSNEKTTEGTTLDNAASSTMEGKNHWPCSKNGNTGPCERILPSGHSCSKTERGAAGLLEPRHQTCHKRWKGERTF